MCLVNRQGRTNSKNLKSYRPYHIGYKCGHCAECVREKRNEWLLRSYFESIDTFERDGYILFETLTYDDLHLPTISRFYPRIQDDFSCFAYEDIRKFTNNLWTSINRLPRMDDYDVKRNVKFFLVSEYGHENIYVDDHGRTRKGTMRPHYHVLFYVKDKRLHPGTLFRLIYHTWRRGNTDYSQNGLSYVMQKDIIGRSYTKSTTKNIIAVSNYVCKYITKQADFMEKVEDRIDRTIESLIGFRHRFVYSDDNVAELGDIDFREYYEKRKEVIRFISPFHRQSRGFGECALSRKDTYDEILSSLQITIPDTKYVKKTYNVPMYYMRKLFYHTITDDEGRYHWILNALGKEHYPQMCEKKVDLNDRRYSKWYRNINDDAVKSLVDSLMDGRSFRDLSEYMVYYRGRIFDRDVEFVDEETGELKTLPSIAQVIDFDINYSPLADTGMYSNGYNIVHRVDLRNAGCDDEDEGFALMIDEFFTELYGDNWYDDTMDESYKAFECSRVINERTDYMFRDFDKVIDLYQLSQSRLGVGKQAYFDLVEELSRKIR